MLKIFLPTKRGGARPVRPPLGSAHDSRLKNVLFAIDLTIYNVSDLVFV